YRIDALTTARTQGVVAPRVASVELQESALPRMRRSPHMRGAIWHNFEEKMAKVEAPTRFLTFAFRFSPRLYPASTPLSISVSSRSFACPTWLLLGLSPPLKMSRRGILVTPYLVARSGASSTFSFPTFTLPANCVAILSMVGPRARQGPHHGAQKSTSTGLS